MSNSTIIWSNYVWQREMPPLDLAKLHAVETAWGITFPADYIECVRVNQGKSPEPSIFSFGEGFETVLNHLYHFNDEPKDSSILTCQESLSAGGIWPDHLIVFACDPGGNQICFDYGLSKSQPSVAIIDHDTGPEGSYTPVAKNFSGFLDMLH
jgi:SMI1-KNR4 cell-wall